MYFTAQFNVWLSWKDSRLSFQSLKNDTDKNLVLDSMAKDLWKPSLVFANNHMRDFIEYVPPKSQMKIEKNGYSTEAPFSQLDEARVYKSSETILWFKTIHYKEFSCQFDLSFFPFDRQKCFIKERRDDKYLKSLN